MKPLVLTVERGDDGVYVVSDDRYLVYGDATSFPSALADYASSLSEYLLLTEREESDRAKAEAAQLRAFLSPPTIRGFGWKMQRISHDSDGQVDDVYIDCDAVHIERMDRNDWWIGIYRGDVQVVSLHISAKRAQVDASVHTDELHCTED